MKKINILTQLEREKLVAVIRGESKEEVMKTVDAVVAGGIHFLEITFTIPHCEEIIEKVAVKYKDFDDIIVGAGTVLEPTSARLAISAGADFIVSPHFDKEIVKLVNSYHVPVIAGATTVKDMLDCLRYGTDIIKLFPGDLFGPSAIKAFKAPLPQAEFMPTGGVSLTNINEWLDNGAFAIGTGSSLTKGAKTGDFEAVTREAKKFVDAVKSH